MAQCPECDTVLNADTEEIEDGNLQVVNTNLLEFDLTSEEDLEEDDDGERDY
jgi:hypothetical protein